MYLTLCNTKCGHFGLLVISVQVTLFVKACKCDFSVIITMNEHDPSLLSLKGRSFRQPLTCDIWKCWEHAGCSQAHKRLLMRTHLIFYQPSTCAQLFTTRSTRQPSPSGTSSEDYYSELAGNPRRVWLQTLLWMCENRMNRVKRKTGKGGGEGQEWDVPHEWGTLNCLNLRVAA